MELRPPGLFEVYFQSPKDTISFSLNRFNRNKFAADSDRVDYVDTSIGDMHFQPAGSRVFCSNESSPNSQLCVIELDPGVRYAIEADMAGRLSSLRTLINIATPRSATLAQWFTAFLTQGRPGGRLAAEAMATLAVTEYLETLAGADSATRPHPMLNRRTLDRTLDYIEAHAHEDIRLADLAAVACLSAHHFSRAFKASTGCSPSQYVLERRVERAKHLLIGTDEPIAKIALDCGFSSQSHMTTVFRKLINLTPAKCRKTGKL